MRSPKTLHFKSDVIQKGLKLKCSGVILRKAVVVIVCLGKFS